MATDISKVVEAAKMRAAQVLITSLPPDITALVIVVPVYRRALADPNSGWRAVVKEAIDRAIDEAHGMPDAATPPRILLPH